MGFKKQLRQYFDNAEFKVMLKEYLVAIMAACNYDEMRRIRKEKITED